MGRTLGLVAAIVGMAVFASGANAVSYTEQYEMSIAPDTAAGTVNGNTLVVADPAGSGTYGPGGFVFCDGIGTFLDDANSSSNQGYCTGPAQTWLAATYTCDFKIRVLFDQAGNGGRKSMSFWSTDNGRGLQLNLSSATFVSGTGSTGTGGSGTFGPTAWAQCRVTITPTTATFYVWDGTAYVSKATAGLGGSGWWGGDSPTGFAIGSTGGSSTTLSNYQMDYFRVYSGSADPAAVYEFTTQADVPCPVDPAESTVTPAGIQTVSGYANALQPAPFAAIDLGYTDVSNNGMTHENEGDGITSATIKAGRECRVNNRDNMYFAVIADLPSPSVTVTFDYYDEGLGTIGMAYDAIDDPGPPVVDRRWTTAAGVVTLTDTNTWKRGSIAVTDAFFGNRQNYGGDFRITHGGVPFYIDNVLVIVDGTSNGPKLAYTLTNTGGDIGGGTPIEVWDAVVADANGNPVASPSWFSLTLDPAAGTDLAPGASATVTAAFDTTTLTTNQTVYVKFTDDTPVPAAWVPTFPATGTPCFPTGIDPTFESYPCLVGQDGWAGSFSGSGTAPASYFEFLVNPANELVVNGGGDSAQQHIARHSVQPVEGLISVKVNVKQGSAVAGGTFWAFHVRDAAGVDYGYWYGSPTTFRARQVVAPDGASDEQTMTTGYETLEMEINTSGQTTSYYVDADGSGPGARVLLYTTSTTAGGGVASVSFEAVATRATSWTEYVYFDDLSVTPVSTFKLRQINLDIIAQSNKVEPAAVATSNNACAGTTPTNTEFAVINNGAYDITNVTVVPVGVAPSWLGTLTVPTNLPITHGASGTVTAEIIWANVTPLDTPLTATIRIAAYWSPTELHQEDRVITVAAVSKLDEEDAQWIVYNGDMDPATVDSSGPGLSFALTGTNPPQRVDPWDDGTAPFTDANEAWDGKAYHLNNIVGAKTEWYSVPDPTNFGTGTRGATVVGRVKTISDNNFQGGYQNGNLFIFSPGFTVEIFWGGPSGIIREANTLQSVQVAGDTNYHIIRATARVEGGNRVVNVYFDENPTPVMHIPNLPFNNRFGTLTGFGFGSTRTDGAQEIYFDWVAATDAGAFAPGGAPDPVTHIGSGQERTCYGKDIWSSSPWPAHCGVSVLRPTETRVFADADDDGDVDMADFAVLQQCLTIGMITPAVPTGTGLPFPEWCICLDHSGTPADLDDDIDGADLTAFLNCAGGPGVPSPCAAP